jgi:hypothetical protein
MLHNQPFKTTAALTLALALATAAPASALIPTNSGGGSTVSTPAAPTIVHLTAPTSGFDWGDAGIGAAGGLAIAMLGVGGGLVISHQRPRRTRPTTTLSN